MISDSLKTAIEEREGARPQAIPNVPVVSMFGHVLPQTPDELTAELGLKVYEKMETEPVIAASDFILRALVNECGWELGTAIEEPGEDDPASAAEYKVAEDIRLALLDDLNDLETPFANFLWDCDEAWGDGHKLFEQVKELKGNRVRLVALKPKPRTNYRLAVTKYMDFVGAVPGVGSLIWDVKTETLNRKDFVEPQDLFLFTIRSKDGDPRGRPAKRACYDPWYRKQLVKPESIKHAAQFGSGRISVEGPAPAKDVILKTTVNVGGTEYQIVDYIASQTASWVNGGVIVLPDGWKATVHTSRGGQETFEGIFDRTDREMVLAYLGVTRATMEAEHGSKADSETAEGMLGQLINFLRDQKCEQIRRQVFRPWVALNYGEDAARLYTPKLLMASVEEEDVPRLIESVARGKEAGVITDEQMPYWDRKIGQPERDVEDTVEPVEEPVEFKTEPSYQRVARTLWSRAERIVGRFMAGLLKGMDGLDEELAEIVQDYAGEEIGREEFVDRFLSTVQSAHENAAIEGARAGGKKRYRLTDEDRDRIEEIVAEQADYLEDFADRIESDPASKRHLQSAKMYHQRAQGTANEWFASTMPDGVTIDWKLGAADHCADCPRYASMGPYEKGELAWYPGSCDSECLTNCKCMLVRSDGVTGPEALSLD